MAQHEKDESRLKADKSKDKSQSHTKTGQDMNRSGERENTSTKNTESGKNSGQRRNSDDSRSGVL